MPPHRSSLAFSAAAAARTGAVRASQSVRFMFSPAAAALCTTRPASERNSLTEESLSLRLQVDGGCSYSSFAEILFDNPFAKTNVSYYHQCLAQLVRLVIVTVTVDSSRNQEPPQTKQAHEGITKPCSGCSECQTNLRFCRFATEPVALDRRLLTT